MDKIINGINIKENLKKDLIKEIKTLKTTPSLVVIQVGNDPASTVYIKNKKKLCEEVGITCIHQKYEKIDEKSLIKEIEKLNKNNQITGILVQLPLPKNINETNIIETIAPEKDVDGLTSKNIGKLFSKQKGLIPCTALGVLKILENTKEPLEGKNIVIVGRSKLIGLPLLALLLNKNATVTICHSKTKNLEETTSKADILIVAIGKKEFITKKYVKKDAIIIDVGINRYENKLYGDCKFNELIEKCKYITKVPGGVGPLTVTMLINNIIEAYKIQNKK